MGLDNGICVKNVLRKDLPIFIRYPFDTDYNKNSVEVCYWRKCWNIRNMFLNQNFFLRKSDECYFKLNIPNIRSMRDIIKYYLKHPNEWNIDNGYWEFKDYKYILKTQYWNLFWLQIWMMFNMDKEVYFYDSY